LQEGFPTPEHNEAKVSPCKFTHKEEEIEYVTAERERQREEGLKIKGRL
jgi:hypothetical protein